MCKNEKFLKTFRNEYNTIRADLNLKNLKKSVISSEVQFICTNFALEITPKQTNVNKNKTVNIREFQLCAFVIMALLASSLVITTGRTGRAGHIYNKAQRLLTAGIVLLAIQFGLQYFCKYRSNGQIAESILFNILFIQPAAWFINLSVLCILRNGQIYPREKATGFIFYLISIAVLSISYFTDGSLLDLHVAEIVASATYGMMLLFFNLQELYLIRHINKAIDNYSDSNSLELTRWIKVSVSLLILLVLFSPITIFFEDSIILMSSAMLTVIFIYYYVFNFICFGISENANMIYQANEEEEKEEISLPTQLKDEKGKNYQRVEEALKQWMERRGHLKTGITIQDAVDEMQIPRYLLTQWIKNTEYEVFSRWIAHLRVEEAKLLMTEHPEYSNEAVAKECGFSSRSYFQKVFRDLTGMTPMEFQSQCNSNGK